MNKKEVLDCLQEGMDNSLIILFAPERATSAPHTRACRCEINNYGFFWIKIKGVWIIGYLFYSHRKIEGMTPKQEIEYFKKKAAELKNKK